VAVGLCVAFLSLMTPFTVPQVYSKVPLELSFISVEFDFPQDFLFYFDVMTTHIMVKGHCIFSYYTDTGLH
jgi:hypothetical protein